MKWLTLWITAVMFVLSVAAWGQSYTVIDLGDIEPTAVIDGSVVFGNLHGVPLRWEDGQITPLQHFGSGGWVNAANARGDAVGWVWLPVQGSLLKVAAFWYPEGRVALLPSSGETEAHGLNMDRVIAGTSLTERRALRWQPEQLEEYLPGGHGARAVDATGRVWGNLASEPIAWDLDGTRHAFGDIVVIQALAFSANNTIAAGFWTNTAAYFSIPMEVTRLALPPLDHYGCEARAINNAHVAVGVCSSFGADPRAMMWPDQHTIIDLSAVTGTHLKSARSISEDGHIIGQTDNQGWLLSPGSPAIALRTNPDPFGQGDRLITELDLSNPGPARVVDMYVGAVFPDGSVFWIKDVNTMEGTYSPSLESNPSQFAPLWAGMGLIAGLNTTWTSFVEHTWTGLEPNGTYHLVVGWTAAGSLADGVINEGDLLALDWKAFTVAGGAVAMNR